MTEATPRPWKLYDPFSDNSWCDVCTESGLEIASTMTSDFPTITGMANAALIVRSVNNYDAALVLLREAADTFIQLCDAIDDQNDPVRGLSEDMFARIDTFLKENDK